MASVYRPVCSCGNATIGYVVGVFEAEKSKRMIAAVEAKFGTSKPTAEQISSVETNVKLGDILDRLGVNSICCRTKLLSQVVFGDLLPFQHPPKE